MVHLAVNCRQPARQARPVREACRTGFRPLDRSVEGRSAATPVGPRDLLEAYTMSWRAYHACDAISGDLPPANKASKARSGGLPSGVYAPSQGGRGSDM
jgi:hypothetical protein